ncbi:MAG: hypothetical protein AAB116_25840 [Candidatus Poribacteria bacterium]
MIFRGVVKGKTIELEQPLPYPNGQNVMLDIYTKQSCSGSPRMLRQIMHEPPHLQWTDVDVLEREIEEAKLSVIQKGVFDEEG